MSKVLDGCCRVLEVLMAAALAIMVVLVFGNVVLRYGFNSGITVSEEVSRWLFVWLTFLGAIVAMREHAHLGSDMLVSRLPVIGKKICLVVGHVLMLYITWLLFGIVKFGLGMMQWPHGYLNGPQLPRLSLSLPDHRPLRVALLSLQPELP
jgi:TRAP-type C4-dicarboxylate transport system permease small subunit